jgi:ketosteroid isomerase-like protein
MTPGGGKMKVKRFIGAMLIASLMVFAGCATTQKADPDEFEKSVLATWEVYSEYMNEGNIEGWLELWDVNGVQLPPGVPAFEGIDEIRTSITTQHQTFDFQRFRIMNKEVEVQGNLGFARGNYSFASTPKEGGDQVDFAGKYLTIFRRQSDGSWKIYRDCFNPNS